MKSTSFLSASFAETDERDAEMHSAIEAGINDLIAEIDNAQLSVEFQT